MALPSAQLGSMSSLSGPSYVPTVVLPPKEEKYWKRALASVLTQMAAGAATQGVSNAMQRDYATDVGEKPAGFWDKAVSGPKVSEKEYTRRQTEKKADERLLANAQLQLGLGDIAAAENRINREAAVQNNDRAASDRRMSWYEEMAAKTRANTADNRWDDARQEGADAKALKRLEQQIEAERPYRESQIGVNKAQTERYNAETEWNRQLMQGALGGGKKAAEGSGVPVDERAKAFAERNNLTPKQQAVQERLKDTSKYPTAEQILDRAQSTAPSQPAAAFGPGAGIGPGYSAPNASADVSQLKQFFNELAAPRDPRGAQLRILFLEGQLPRQDPQTQAATMQEIQSLRQRFNLQ